MGSSGVEHPYLRAAAACLGCYIGCLGCSVYDESLVRGGDGGQVAPTCTLATWPLQPRGKNLGGGPELVFALRAFDFGETYDPNDGTGVVAERPVGYDLDNKCTLGTDVTETQYPGVREENSCTPAGAWVSPLFGDLPGGRDNGLRNIITFVENFFPGFGTPTYNASIKTGEVSLVMQLKNYNGQANDDDVNFAIYTPGRFRDNAANAGAVPQFDGQDEWPIASLAYLNPTTKEPKFASRAAWVNNNVLVASFPNFEFRLRIGISQHGVADAILKFLDVFFTAKIANEQGIWVLKGGHIASKWKTQDLFSQIKYFPAPSGPGKNMCMNAFGYNVVHDYMCRSTDIYSGGLAPSPTCDAVSVGIGFEAVQAKFGPTIEFSAQESDCPAAFDPIKDNCSYAWGTQDGGAPVPGTQPDASAP
jgi:hypothetical protein